MKTRAVAAKTELPGETVRKRIAKQQRLLIQAEHRYEDQNRSYEEDRQRLQERERAAEAEGRIDGNVEEEQGFADEKARLKKKRIIRMATRGYIRRRKEIIKRETQRLEQLNSTPAGPQT